MNNIIGKKEILDILNDWNIWKKDIKTGIIRNDHIAKLKGFLTTNHIITITGPRRAGKSFIMKQIVKELTNNGTNIANVLYVNLEDPRFTGLDVELLNRIYETYLEFMNPNGQGYVFLDEVQEIQGWEKWVRMMQELGKAKIVVTGSNANLLSRELGTLLTGRHLDLTVFPLSFGEFLDFNDISVKDRLDAVAKKIEIQNCLNKYCEFGSFPEVTLSSEKKEILLGYFEDIVQKDLLRRFKIRKSTDLQSLTRFYLSNISSTITFTSMEKHLKISAVTIEKFSGYLEQVYLVFFIKRFSFKVREQDKSPRKVYSIDTGLSNIVGFRSSQNIGRIAENIVFLELKRRQSIERDIDIFYWKDEYHREVDFVIKKGLQVTELIQVCWDISDEKTKKREIQSLLKAMKELRLKISLVITEEYEGEEHHNGTTIRFVKLKEWLLSSMQNPLMTIA